MADTPLTITVQAADLPEVVELVKQLTAERDQARRLAVALEQQNARAVELLDQVDTGGWFSPDELKDVVDEAKAVLRGDGALEAEG